MWDVAMILEQSDPGLAAAALCIAKSHSGYISTAEFL